MIELKNIYKSYKKTVLKGLSFSVKAGETVGLLGNNGCGKTTTVNVICNISPCQNGEYFFDNQLITKNSTSFKSEMGVVLSKPYYIDAFSAKEYWRFAAKFQKVPKEEIEKRINDLLIFLELEDADLAIKKLSAGNQMKVSLGAALIHNPKVLILDEPFANLDIAVTEKLISIINNFKKKKTIFITSHNLDLMSSLCDRFLIMDEGKIGLEIKKSDFPDIESLKNAIKQHLAAKNTVQDLDWL